MDTTFEEKMRRALLARRARLLSAEAALGAEAKVLLESEDVDLVDHAQTATQREVVTRLDERERQELGELDAALERIAEGRYGVCARCEEEIPKARLEVLPEARRCASCD